MRTSTAAFAVVVLLAGGAAASSGEEGPATAEPGQVAGLVQTESSPLARVAVYAYEMADLSLRQATTAESGHFRFAELPAGVYKLIAYKPGFHPAVVMLSRAAAEASQFVEIRLQEETNEVRDGESYWTLREGIPPDVLREMETLRLVEEARPSSILASRAFQGAVEAVTGYEDPGLTEASVLTGAAIDMEGRIGSLRIGVDGEYLRMAAESGRSQATTEGEAAQIAVLMGGTGTGSGRVDLTTVTQRLGPAASLGAEADFERYRISWSQPVGERSTSHFSAQYVSDSQFYRPSWAGADEGPGARALRVEGVYQVDVSDRASVETGVRYREHYRSVGGVAVSPTLENRTLEVFGRSGMRLLPKVLVEYGLYTQLKDGSMALAPQGELVVQLDPKWQAISTVSQRIEDGERPEAWYWAPLAMEATARGCEGLDEHCYRLVLERQGGGDDLFSVSALHREMAETVRLHFHDDPFRQMESLYLVEGDEIPEMQLVVQRRVTPQVVARLQSSYADGGGGLVYAFGEPSRENHVRYLVTSIDTRFAQTSTGIFVAFHHLEQSLLGTTPDSGTTATSMDLERLQLMLSQDLDVLEIATDLALHLNFEVSRGQSPYTLEPSEALRRRLTGGVTLRF